MSENRSFEVLPDGSFRMKDGTIVKAALGRGGRKPEDTKTEGDEATPIGTYPIRRVLYRADRLEAPVTRLPVAPLQENDGWCDAVDDPLYNQHVTHPYPASAERMWRDDELYDVVVILGHNDDPVVPDKGSAIFWHCARPDYRPTLGCVALARADILKALTQAQPGDTLTIHSPD
ncbi:MAG: L,D-transpeptidase family protein [Alphaproteobacteria bacterium]